MVQALLVHEDKERGERENETTNREREARVRGEKKKEKKEIDDLREEVVARDETLKRD